MLIFVSLQTVSFATSVPSERSSAGMLRRESASNVPEFLSRPIAEDSASLSPAMETVLKQRIASLKGSGKGSTPSSEVDTFVREDVRSMSHQVDEVLKAELARESPNTMLDALAAQEPVVPLLRPSTSRMPYPEELSIPQEELPVHTYAETICTDKLVRCSEYAEFGHCTTEKSVGFMNTNCRESCGWCNVPASWYLGREDEACDTACAIRGLECSEREMALRSSDVNSAEKIDKVMLGAGVRCSKAEDLSSFDQLIEQDGVIVPRFRPHDHACEYTSLELAPEHMSCHDVPLSVTDRTQRLCYCSHPQGTHSALSVEVGVVLAGISATDFNIHDGAKGAFATCFAEAFGNRLEVTQISKIHATDMMKEGSPGATIFLTVARPHGMNIPVAEVREHLNLNGTEMNHTVEKLREQLIDAIGSMEECLQKSGSDILTAASVDEAASNALLDAHLEPTLFVEDDEGPSARRSQGPPHEEDHQEEYHHGANTILTPCKAYKSEYCPNTRCHLVDGGCLEFVG